MYRPVSSRRHPSLKSCSHSRSSGDGCGSLVISSSSQNFLRVSTTGSTTHPYDEVAMGPLVEGTILLAPNKIHPRAVRWAVGVPGAPRLRPDLKILAYISAPRSKSTSVEQLKSGSASCSPVKCVHVLWLPSQQGVLIPNFGRTRAENSKRVASRLLRHNPRFINLWAFCVMVPTDCTE